MVKKISGCGLCLIIRYSLSEDTVSLSPSLDFLLDNYMNALRGFPSVSKVSASSCIANAEDCK